MGGVIFGLVILVSVKKNQVAQNIGSKPANTSPWHLHQLMPPGFYQTWVPVLTSFDNELWFESMREINPFLLFLPFYYYYYNNSKPNWDWMFPWAVSFPSPSSIPFLSFLTVLPHSVFHDRVKPWRPWNRINVSIRHLVTVTQRYLKEALEVLYEI